MSILPTHAPKLFGARKSGDEVMLIYPNHDRRVPASFIGSGRFTTAYRLVSGDVILYTFYEDFSKSILSQAYKHYGKTNAHLPRIERVGRIDYRGKDANVYRARYYRPADNLSDKNEKILDTLQDLHEGACFKFKGNIVRSYKSDDFNKYIVEGKGLPDSIRECLEHLMYQAQDCGDHYIFDNFDKRNMGLDARGRLVFIDPMFDMEKIQRDHDKRRRLHVRDIWATDNAMS